MSTIDNTQSDSNASNQTDEQTETQPTWTDLTAFQQEALQAVAVVEEDPEREESGSKVLDELELRYQDGVTTARLYPNLDELADAGLIEKGQLDRRTNYYHLTDAGEALLEEEAKNLAQVAGLPIPMTDGGEVEQPPISVQIEELNESFQETNIGGMMVSGRAGFHTFYANDDPALTTGMTTFLHMAFNEVTEELWLDEDIVRDRHGEVTPETVSKEFADQIESFIGSHYFVERMTEELEATLEAHQ